MTGTPIFDELAATFETGLLGPHTADQPAPRTTSTHAPRNDEPPTWSLTGTVITTARQHA